MIVTNASNSKSKAGPDDPRRPEGRIISHCLVFLLMLALSGWGLTAWRSVEVASLRIRIGDIENELSKIKDFMEHNGFKNYPHVLTKRQVENTNNLNEDGVPIVGVSYAGNDNQNTEGLRIYDAFFQHKSANEIPHDRNLPMAYLAGTPIKPHHRVSAAWAEQRSKSTHDLNAHFDDKVFRESYPSQTSRQALSDLQRPIRVSSNAIDLPNQGRVKATPSENQDSFSSRIISTEQRATNNRAAVRSGDSFRTTAGQRYPARLSGDRGGYFSSRNKNRMLRRGQRRSAQGASGKFIGLKSVHYVGKFDHGPRGFMVDQDGGLGRVLNHDGVFRNWREARWVTRMGGDSSRGFDMTHSGAIRVKEAGVYLIYAQVAYLDEHDVNAFEVLANDDPFLLCTCMTHTPHSATKANTCYTSGITYLEQGDEVKIKDLELGRWSVLLPAHTFFGAVQLSSLRDS